MIEAVETVEAVETSPLLQNVRTENRTGWLGITLEPAILFLHFAIGLTTDVYTHVIMFHTCHFTLKMDTNNCTGMLLLNATDVDHQLESKVQPYVSGVLVAGQLIESVGPAFVSLFLGPWSDINGRKPMIVIAYGGYMLKYFICGALMYFPYIDPWLFLTASIPVGLSGGQCAIISGMLCYLTDLFKRENRVMRIGLREAVFIGGLLIGTISSSFAYYALGSVTVFAIAFASVTCGLIYVCIFVKEPNYEDLPVDDCRVKSLFDCSLVSDMFKVSARKRQGYDRMILWLCITGLMLLIFVLDGSVSLHYLFVRHKFNWTLREYSLFSCASLLLWFVGTSVGVTVFSKVLKVSDSALALVATTSAIIEFGVKAWSPKSWYMYLAAAISMMKYLVGPMARATISKVVTAKDAGKVHSLTSSLETFPTFIALMIYTTLYWNTLNIFPGAFYVLSAAIYAIVSVIFIVIYCLRRKYPEQEELPDVAT